MVPSDPRAAQVPVPQAPAPQLSARVSVVDEASSPASLPGTPLLVCFPSAGLSSTIVGHQMIRHLKLPRIASVRSPLLPPASVVVDRRPNPPVRIHGNQTLVVALSEFPAPGPFAQPFAEQLLSWAQRKGLGPVIVVEGVLRKEDGEPGPTEKMMGIASNSASEPLLQKAQVPLLEEGIVGGLTAELLNLAAVVDRPLAVVFASTTDPGYPDYRAAAALAVVLDKMVPGLSLDPVPMLEQAEVLEKMLKQEMRRHKAASPPETAVGGPTADPKEPSIYG